MSAIVDEILAAFGLSEATANPFSDSIHDNFRVQSGNDACFLKIVDGEYPEHRVRSQLEFMNHLRDGGLPVAPTRDTHDGEPFAKTGDGSAIGILSDWIEGPNVSELNAPGWPAKCGELLARLHQRSAEFQPSPEFNARAWDDIYATSPSADWLACFLNDVQSGRNERRVVSDACDVINTYDDQHPTTSKIYGLLHADFHADNLIFDGTTMWIIDFEEIGWGHWLFDLTWPEALHAQRHGFANGFSNSFRRGYGTVFPRFEHSGDLRVMRLAAGIGVLDMIHTSPTPNDGSKAREWFLFAVEWMLRSLR